MHQFKIQTPNYIHINTNLNLMNLSSSSSSSSSIILSVFIIFILSVPCSASNIFPDTILSASDPNSKWSSLNNTFTFTFISQTQLDPFSPSPSPSSSSSAFYAAILYDNKIPIWVASDSNGIPSPADSTATLNFAENGNLFIRNGSTTNNNSDIVWQSNTASLLIQSASLEETGNFILKNSTNSNIWSTFDFPTNTLVPSQSLGVNQILRSGLYSFRLLSNGNLTLKWNDTVTYYNSGINGGDNGNLTSPKLTMRAIGAVSIEDPSLKGAKDIIFSSDYAESGDILRFLRLGNDGNLRIYSSAKGSGGDIRLRWSAVSDQCMVFGYCGNYGICSYSEGRPVCGCASQNFRLVDPRDRRKGCKREVELDSCVGNVTMFEFGHAMFLTFYPQNDPGSNSESFSIGISACKGNCLETTGCIASTSVADGSGLCYLKTSSVAEVSGYQSPALPSTSYVKVCKPVVPNTPATSSDREEKDGWKLKPWVVVVVVMVTILILIVMEGGLWCWCFRNSPKFGALSSQYALLEYASGAPVQFAYKELMKTTKGFKEKLGAGGFGAVYRGVLANRSVVAVKQLEGIEQGEKQFRMEVATISSTHHLNLVRLIGFCSEGRHRLLVYEFMKNGSLDRFLFHGEHQQQKVFAWGQRYNIALGTARGITYLHEECRDCIVHCDIKPENILLDENYNAKVSDFGLAKLVNSKDQRYRTLTSIRGTRGYLAPEWLANLPITSKSDVYSYGMVLLEIVSGKRNFDVSFETNRKKFSIWAYEEFYKGNVQAIIDKMLPMSDIDMEQVIRAIKVSFWCIQEQPSHRPIMSKVVQMLEGIFVIEKPPPPKSITEGSVGGTIVNASSIGAHSMFASATPSVSW